MMISTGRLSESLAETREERKGVMVVLRNKEGRKNVTTLARAFGVKSTDTAEWSGWSAGSRNLRACQVHESPSSRPQRCSARRLLFPSITLKGDCEILHHWMSRT